MKSYITLVNLAVWMTLTKAGQIFSAYNLVAAPTYFVPQTYSTNALSFAAHPEVTHAQPLRDVSNHVVIENSIAESQLPSELLNPFYRNPHIADALAKESWFTNKEMPVFQRQSERIPRTEIAKLVSRIEHRAR